MRKCVVLGLLACGCLVVGTHEAFAQNAQIIGTVKDTSGGVVPGATVTAKNLETGRLRTTVTDPQGDFRLPALPPGTYSVTEELAGFNTETRSGITLVIDETATVNFSIKPATLAETVTVKVDSVAVDTSASTVSTSVSNAQIQDLPVSSRRWVDLAMLTPGTSQDGIRGQFYRGNVNVGAGGASYQNGFVVDGVNNTWAEMGEPRQNFAMDSIREFKVSTSNFKAEYGLATGGMVTVVSKSGTNDLHGSGLLFYRNANLTAKEYFQTTKPDYKRYQYGATLGGPIIRNKIHFFGAYEGTNETPYLTVNAGGLWPQYEGTFPSKQYRWTYTAKGDYTISGSQSLFLRVSQEYEYRPINTVGGRTSVSASMDFAVPRDSYVVGHTWVTSSRTVNDFRFQYAFSKYEVAPPNSHGSWAAGDFGPGRLGLCAPVFSYPSISLGGCGNSQMGPETRWQIKDDFSFLKADWGGTHQFKTGADFSYVPFQEDGIGSPLGSWTFPKDKVYDPNDKTTWPTNYSNSLPHYSDMPVKLFSVFLQDDWQVGKNVTFNLGLRYDLQLGSFNEYLYDQMKRIADKFGDPYYAQFPLPIPFIDVKKRGDHNNFGPRVGVAWDPTGGGVTNVHAAYGMFYDNIKTLGNNGEMTWMQSKSITINNPSFPDALNGKSRESYISTAPPNITVFDNKWVTPYAHQFNVGVARMLTNNLSLALDGTYVNRYSEREGVDINLPDQVTKVKPYPQFGRVSFGQSTSDSTYRALLVKVEKRMSNRYQFLLSYTLSRAMGNSFTNSFADYYGYKKVKTYSGSDRRHRLVVSGILQLPYEAQMSVIADFRTSLPFGPSSSLGDLNGDGYTGDLPVGIYPSSGCRGLDLNAVNAVRTARGLAATTSVACSGYENVDIRFSKAFRIQNHRIELIAQLFNVANRANFNTPNGAITSALFGTTTALVPYINAGSRQAELAVRWQF